MTIKNTIDQLNAIELVGDNGQNELDTPALEPGETLLSSLSGQVIELEFMFAAAGGALYHGTVTGRVFVLSVTSAVSVGDMYFDAIATVRRKDSGAYYCEIR